MKVEDRMKSRTKTPTIPHKIAKSQEGDKREDLDDTIEVVTKKKVNRDIPPANADEQCCYYHQTKADGDQTHAAHVVRQS